MAAIKRRNTEQIVGYILIAIVVLGVAYLVYWTVFQGGFQRGYPGLEKFRGEAPTYGLGDLILA